MTGWVEEIQKIVEKDILGTEIKNKDFVFFVGEGHWDFSTSSFWWNLDIASSFS
jgi:hypothetical protein